MKKVIISAPFGNYLSSEHATSTIGTYTIRNRAGFLRWWLFWRILRTLRYRPSVGGWTNKLGLPNPGIRHLERLDKSALLGKIVSVHGFTPDEWSELLARTYAAGALPSGGTGCWIELNVSCPNIGHLSVPQDLFDSTIKLFGADSVIVKIPPVSYWPTFELAYASGVRIFHATNTLPVPCGGLSGKALKRVSLDVVKRIKDARPDVTVIGGGGITSAEDAVDYVRAGATHVSVASALFRRGWLRRTRERFLGDLARTVG